MRETEKLFFIVSPHNKNHPLTPSEKNSMGMSATSTWQIPANSCYWALEHSSPPRTQSATSSLATRRRHLFAERPNHGHQHP